MIVQIRGTSGSGKSTIMKRVMMCLKENDKSWAPIMEERRKAPLWYYHRRADVAVLGHYESPCGGCDTVGSAAAVFDLIGRVRASDKLKSRDTPILCEGLLLSEDVKWSSQMEGLKALFLTTPLETCIKQIEGRRAAAGNEKPLNTANTSNRVATIERARVRLLETGKECYRCAPRQAPHIILKWLRLRAEQR